MGIAEVVFIKHPTPLFVTLSSGLALAALSPRPAFTPLILLLAALQLYAQIIIKREHAQAKLALLWVSLTAAIAFSHIGPSMSALPNSAMSVIFLSLISSITSFLGLSAILAQVHLTRPTSHILLFPALWATLWGTISHVSPVGRLATWSPVVGLGPYDWTRQVFGPWGIDWIVAAWSVVLAHLVGSWFVGSPAMLGLEGENGKVGDEHRDNGDQDGRIVPVDLPEDASIVLDAPRPSPAAVGRPGRSGRVMFVGLGLLALMIPSYINPDVPLPRFSPDTTPLSVACVLPQSRHLKTGPALLKDYITESQKLNAAKILLWPEGAVRFDDFTARDAAVKEIQNKVAIPYNVFVGMTFEEVVPSSGSGRSYMRRNAMVLVGRDGPIFEYEKRNLVPIAESFSQIAGKEPPTVHTLLLTPPKGTTVPEWGNRTRPLPVTSSICLDFSTPSSFSALESKPALILAPARTWHPTVGLAMWEQAKARASETGTYVLWCDGGEGGVSGIAGNGYHEVMQVGDGSWVRGLGVGYPFNDKRTMFTSGGEWFAMFVAWGILGLGWVADIGYKNGGGNRQLAWIRGPALVAGNWVQGFRERRRIARGADTEAGEEQDLLGDEDET
ncbi:hypothetical protein JAAARDRAFT_53575 [Jaapia argillacea MUCL 33604]|uniref:CN hydrolase domain-containing protein n=1 Tax=Jaapia argillacea MUCL 33604 TaxID=933084 RepID=A0A067QL56_9AGAM|nr:hypothetical protein JAAARDRAFT_53575 [Jaapia argillacea MUCL 33604]